MSDKNMMGEIMRYCHGTIDISKLIPTETKNVFLDNQSLFSAEVFYDGLTYMQLLPRDMKFPGEGDIRQAQLKAIQSMADKMQEKAKQGDWEYIFGVIDKKIGLPRYIQLLDKMPDDVRYDAFVEIYTRSEFGFELLQDFYPKIFEYAKFSQQRLDRLQTLALQHGDEITIYHGESNSHPVYDHYSCTLNEQTAKFFAYRYSNDGEVWKRTIKIEDALDYLTDRNEEEVLYNYSLQK